MANTSVLNGPCVWRGENIAKSTRWNFEFEGSDIDDIEHTLGVLKKKKLI